LNLVPTGIFLHDNFHPYATPLKLIDRKGTDFFTVLEVMDALVPFTGEEYIVLHTLALKLLLTKTNAKHIYVTSPVGTVHKVKISRILNGNNLYYRPGSGISKRVLLNSNDIERLEDKDVATKGT